MTKKRDEAEGQGTAARGGREREGGEGRRKKEKGGEGCWSSCATAEPEGVGVKAEEAGELCWSRRAMGSLIGGDREEYRRRWI